MDESVTIDSGCVASECFKATDLNDTLVCDGLTAESDLHFQAGPVRRWSEDLAGNPGRTGNAVGA